MKRFFAFLFVIPLLLAGCTKKVEDKIVGLVVDAGFISCKVFVGQEIDLSAYDLTVVYSSNKNEVVSLSDAQISGLDTSAAGEITISISYGGKTVSVNKEVLTPHAIDARFFDESLTIYYGETLDLDSVELAVLFDDGNEHSATLADADEVDIDYTVDGEEKTLTVSVCGVEASIKYTVTYRPIEVGVVYDLVVEGAGTYKCQLEETASGYKLVRIDGAPLQKSYTLTAAENNCFTTRDLVNYEMTTFLVYRAGTTVYLKSQNATFFVWASN